MRHFTRYRWITAYIAYVILIVLASIVFAPVVGISQVGDVLALIQAVVDILVVIPAIFAFIWQMRELQSYPDLDLKWNIQVAMGTNEVSLEIPINSTKEWTIQPILMNNGSSVTPWYLVSFSVPAELLGTFDDFKLQPILGTSEQHWKIAYIQDPINPPYFNFTFTSNGEIASYPNFDLFLATLHIRLYSGKEYKESYPIRYTIVADKGKRKDLVFPLKTHKENLSKKISPEDFLDSLLRFPNYGGKQK